jgi:hypothetical protein
VRTDLLRGTALHVRVGRKQSTLTAISRDGAVSLGAGRGGADDPTVHGAVLRIASATAEVDIALGLPARDWRAVTKHGALVGWRSDDRRALAGPITSILVKRGAILRITGRGKALGITLSVDPEPMSLALSAGTQRWCLRFGGRTRWKPGATFSARGATAPTECSP